MKSYKKEQRKWCHLAKVRDCKVIPDLAISNPDLAAFRNSDPAGDYMDLGTTRFSDRRTMRLIKLMAIAMLSAATKRQYSSVFPLLRHYLLVFWQNV